MIQKKSNRKIATIVITAMLAISAFPMLMTATLDEANAKFTAAVNTTEEDATATQNVTNATSEEDTDKEVFPKNQTVNTSDATNITTPSENETSELEEPEAIEEEALKNETSKITANASKTWYVDDDGGAGINFTKIQDAIDNASSGDTIFVFEGYYKENLKINKFNLTIIGNGSANTTIDGNEGKCVQITNKSITFTGFKVVNSDHGFYLSSAKWCTITNNNISSDVFHDIYNNYGIYLLKSDKNTITNNTIGFNKKDGIYSQDSSSNEITGNEISSNKGNGFYFYTTSGGTSNKNTVENNTLSSNGKGIYIYVYQGNSNENRITNNSINSNEGIGIHIHVKSDNDDVSSSFNENQIEGNTINSNKGTGIYAKIYKKYRGSSNFNKNRMNDNEIKMNTGSGIYLNADAGYSYYSATSNCNENEIEGNEIAYNEGNGVIIYGYQKDAGSTTYCNSNKIRSNTINANAGNGIKIYGSGNSYCKYNKVEENELSYNDKTGIHIGDKSFENSLKNNTVNTHGYGIWLNRAEHYITSDNTVNGEPIYHFYKVQAYEEEPVIVENLVLTKPNVINIAKMTIWDSRYIIVRNCTLKYSEKGVYMSSSKFCTVSNISMSRVDGGIHIYDSEENEINSNEIKADKNGGLYLYNSKENEISSNNIKAEKGYGIYMDANCEDNNLKTNTVKSEIDNYYGLYIENARNWISQDNIVNGEQIYHFYKADGSVTPIILENLVLTKPRVSNLGKVVIADSQFITVRNCTLKNSGSGVRVSSGNGITITNNDLSTDDFLELYNTYGIYADGFKYGEITNNSACNNQYGISMLNMDRSTISKNKLNANKKNGLYLKNSTYGEITGNEISSNKGNGFYFYTASGGTSNKNTVENNTLSSNGKGIYIYVYQGNSNENRITNNSINSNEGIGIHIHVKSDNDDVSSSFNENQIEGNTINSNKGTGIYAKIYKEYSGSSNFNKNRMNDNEIKMNTGQGIYLYAEGVDRRPTTNCNENRIEGNEIESNTGNGILIYGYEHGYRDPRGCYQNSNKIRSNTINSNAGNGVKIYGSGDKSYCKYNKVEENTISQNKVGTHLGDKCSNNKIFHNNFINNTEKQAKDDKSNLWDEGAETGGNYWADHECTGNPSNGSQPYKIDADSIDHYPFQSESGWITDLTPPASITNLQSTIGQTWINWTWTNPADADFSHVTVYLDGTWRTNTSAPYYNSYGLTPDTWYEIGTHTVDTSGNINTTWVNETAETLPPTGKPTITISTDKTSYKAGDTMTVNIGFKNPTATSVDSYFVWYFGLPDYGYWTPIMTTQLTLPPNFDQSYDIPIPVGNWGSAGFNATWRVGLLETTPPYKTISEDTADWKYTGEGETAPETPSVLPKEIAKEIKKTVERAELPGEKV